ncbi:hypothetical protein [Parafrankia sp. Ea1.12]|uniref:hypothetical protein n=1 Tax=Parafrankia sp. Ea1.12 TaxID=573499 RepID=UPI000DD40EE3|nr:hypothetical protein [Parafrankia sp. Ea1.12]
MTAHVVLPAAQRAQATRRRAAATIERRPLLVGLLVLDDVGVPVEVVSPFGSETAARQWADLYGIETYQVLPARIAGGRG